MDVVRHQLLVLAEADGDDALQEVHHLLRVGAVAEVEVDALHASPPPNFSDGYSKRLPQTHCRTPHLPPSPHSVHTPRHLERSPISCSHHDVALRANLHAVVRHIIPIQQAPAPSFNQLLPLFTHSLLNVSPRTPSCILSTGGGGETYLTKRNVKEQIAETQANLLG